MQVAEAAAGRAQRKAARLQSLLQEVRGQVRHTPPSQNTRPGSLGTDIPLLTVNAINADMLCAHAMFPPLAIACCDTYVLWRPEP